MCGESEQGKGTNPSKPYTRMGPYPTRWALAAPLWAGRPLSTLTSTGEAVAEAALKGSTHLERAIEASNKGWRHHQGGGAIQPPAPVIPAANNIYIYIYMSPHRCMKAASCGYTTLIIISHLVFLTARQSSQKNRTQCPGIYKQKCPGITQLPSLVMRAPLENIQSSSWYNSNLSSEMYSRSSVCNPVPRTNLPDSNDVCKQVVSSSLPPKRKRDRKHRRERRAREREERGEAFNHDARWASQRPGDSSSSSVPAQVTQSGLQDSDPISAMRPAVYYPSESVGNPLTNENSPLPIDLESGEFSGLRPGLYKPADPTPQHDTWAFSPVAYSSEKGPPSPTRTLAASSSDSRTRTGIVYPLQPRSQTSVSK